MAPKREEFDVKEEFDSPDSRASEAGQPDQPSVLPPMRSDDQERAPAPENSTPIRNPDDSSPAPWFYVMSELRCVQHTCCQLRTQLESPRRRPRQE